MTTEHQCLLENLILFDESKDLNKCKLVNVDQSFFYTKNLALLTVRIENRQITTLDRTNKINDSNFFKFNNIIFKY